MASFSQVIQARTSEYSDALEIAYADWSASNGSARAAAYQALIDDSDYSNLAPSNSSVFNKSTGPTADLEDINAFNDWLAANPSHASALNLAVQVRVDSSSFSSLDNAGVLGGNKRRWKGQRVYTFADGILVGKDSKLIAAFGNIPDDVPYVGSDTLIFFDGIPNTRGTQTPGVTAFGGDVVISGSLQGMNGVITIDDVIQLETGVTNPAGIGVDDNGRIQLRHRGEGFYDLVDRSEVDTILGEYEKTVKLWVGSQNTASTRWGTSIIPNSNFSQKEITYINGQAEEKPAGSITIGVNEERIIMEEEGICSFDASLGAGVLLPAVPLEIDPTGAPKQRYAVRIRVWGNVSEEVSDNTEAEGLFVGVMETSDEDIGEASHIFDGINPSSLYHDRYTVHSANTTMKLLTATTTDAGGFVDGDTIPLVNEQGGTPDVKSYVYEVTPGTKNISLAIWAQNYNEYVHLDYCVVNKLPTLASDISDLIDVAVQEIDQEDTRSLVNKAGMADSSAFVTIGSAVLVDDADGGDSNTESTPDAAVQVQCSQLDDGILTNGIGCNGTSYTVGVRMRLADGEGPVNVSVTAFETSTGGIQAGATGIGPHVINPTNEEGIQLIKYDVDNASTGITGTSITMDDGWATLLGTYQVAEGVVTPASFPNNLGTSNTVQAFSIAIQADAACTMIVDYIYVVEQSISADIAEEYANAAYAGAEGYVHAMNELLVKERGSILPNASMSLYDADGLPVGYSSKNGSITRELQGDGDVQIAVTHDASVNTCKLLTPPWSLGEADRYSIGVRIKSLSGVQAAKVWINYLNGTVSGSDVSISNESGWSRTVAAATDIHQLDGDGNETNGIDSWTIEPSYSSILATWDRETTAPDAELASIMIECDDSFEVDYILVKEQTVSFNLASTTAEEKAAETFEALANEFERINEDLNNETNSLIGNAGFMSYQVVDTFQHPKKWIGTRNATDLKRVVKLSEVSTFTDPYGNTTSVTPSGETIDNKGQDDACLRLETAGGAAGILSEKWQIPPQASSQWTDSSGTVQSASSSGRYVISVQARASESGGTVAIYALETTNLTDPDQKFLLDNGTHSSPISNSTVYTSATSTQIYLLDMTTKADDGNPEEGVATAWKNIGGTYTPSSNAQSVSFEIVYIPPSASAKLYIDYVYLAPQMLGEEFITAYTDAEIASLDLVDPQDIADLNSDLQAEIARIDGLETDYTDLSTLFNSIDTESNTLLPNGNFVDFYTDTGTGKKYIKNWIKIGDAASSDIELLQQDDGSIGTYIKFDNTNRYDSIVSKAIENPIFKVISPTNPNEYNVFNFAMRVAGVHNTLGGQGSLVDITSSSTFDSPTIVLPNPFPSYTFSVDSNSFTTADTDDYQTDGQPYTLQIPAQYIGATTVVYFQLSDKGTVIQEPYSHSVNGITVGGQSPHQASDLTRGQLVYVIENSPEMIDFTIDESYNLIVADLNVWSYPGQTGRTDFKINVLVHEYTGAFSANKAVVPTGSTIPTISAWNNLSTVAIGANGSTTDMNLIDLANPEEGAAIGNIVGDDAGDGGFNDWRIIVGSYAPSGPDVTMVSFEIKCDHDFDADGAFQEIRLDSCALEVSSVSFDIAEAVAGAAADEAADDVVNNYTRVETQTNNIVYNGNFNIGEGTRTGRKPTGWSQTVQTGYTLPEAPAFAYANSTTKYGLAVTLQGNSSSNINAILSRPFEILNDDYKILIRIKLVDSVTSVTCTIGAAEFDSYLIPVDTPAAPWEAIMPSEVADHSASSTVNAERLVTDILDISNGNDYITVTTSWQVFELEYIPTSTAKWASLYFKYNGTAPKDFEIQYIKCMRDTRGLSEYRNTTPAGLLGSRFTFATIRAALNYYPTNPETPTVDYDEIMIKTGFEAHTSRNLSGTNIVDSAVWNTVVADYNGDNAQPTYEIGAQSLKKAYEYLDEKTSRNGGFLFSSPKYYYNDQPTNVLGRDIGVLGVSYFYPEVTTKAGWDEDEEFIWVKQNSDPVSVENAGGTVHPQFKIYDYNSDQWWGIGALFDYSSDDYLQFRMDGALKAQISRANNAATLNFTGQHRCEDFNDDLTTQQIGLIVVSTGFYNNLVEKDKPTINSALPIVELSSERNQKSAFGVLSDKEDLNGQSREYRFGNFVSVHETNGDLDRLVINSLGEGAIWICNINGDLENGDYITTCEIPGYGMRQDDDLLHNYTVAKITQDCDFELDNPYYDCVEFEHEGQTYRKAFVGCTYHCG